MLRYFICSPGDTGVVQDKDITTLNNVVEYLQNSTKSCLHFPNLDVTTLQVVVYVDSSFANRQDKSSQLGYLICLMDITKRCSILQYRSQKSRRIVRPSTAGETLAFAETFDAAFILRHDLSRMLGQHIPVLMLTDSESLFKTLTRARYTTERRLLVDIAAARQAYQSREISNIGLIRSEDNAADGLTKLGPNKALYRLLSSSQIHHTVRQWVVEDDNRGHSLRR
jgi:hypothetical protein